MNKPRQLDYQSPRPDSDDRRATAGDIVFTVALILLVLAVAIKLVLLGFMGLGW